jgi:hypothetical protein
MIIANVEATQLEATQDGWQQQSQWTAVARLQWMAAAAMGNNGSTIGGGTAEQLQWAMRWQRGETIATNAEAVQWEFGIFALCVFA